MTLGTITQTDLNNYVSNFLVKLNEIYNTNLKFSRTKTTKQHKLFAISNQRFQN
jgi:hypothetical protein